MRPTEVAIMRTTDLNTSGSIWEYAPSSYKKQHLDAERLVMIGPKAQAVLKSWLRTDLEAYLFCPAETLRNSMLQGESVAEPREARNSGHGFNGGRGPRTITTT
jgi:hypothetical protein